MDDLSEESLNESDLKHLDSLNLTLSNELLNYLNQYDSSNSTLQDDVSQNVLVIIGYSIIVVLSICGNSLVCHVALDPVKGRSTTNILIASLALADLMTTVFNIPLNVARMLLESWPFGSALCVFVPFIQVTCVYVSTFTMIVIAFHRHWAVSRRLNSPAPSTKVISIIVVITWIIAGLLAIPHSIFNKVVVHFVPEEVFRCQISIPVDKKLLTISYRQFLSVEAFLTQYLLPLLITCFFYVKIAFVILRQGKLALSGNSFKERQRKSVKTKRIIMLALVVLAFAFCWFPLNLYHLLADFGLINKNFRVFLLCHWFAMSSVCYNPFIYCWLNTNFRSGARRMYFFVTCRKQIQSQLNVHPEDNQSQARVNDVSAPQTSVLMQLQELA